MILEGWLRVAVGWGWVGGSFGDGVAGLGFCFYFFSNWVRRLVRVGRRFWVRSCSQILVTCQPFFRRMRETRWSRRRLRSSLADQKGLLEAGHVPWAGQACQKQPSMKSARLSLGKMKSGLPGSLKFFRI